MEISKLFKISASDGRINQEQSAYAIILVFFSTYCLEANDIQNLALRVQELSTI